MRRLEGLLIVLSALLLAGCGGGGGGGSSSGGGNGGGGNGGPSQFTAEQRNAAMDKVANKYDELLAAGPATAMDQLAAYTKTLPEFEDAVAQDGTVVAHFKDHRVFIFADNFKSDVTIQAPEPPELSRAPTPIPSKKTALLMQSNVDDTQDGTPFMVQIEQMLQLRGYTTNLNNSVQIDTLKAMGQNLGVFYIHTHGAQFWWHDQFDSREYGLFTDTLINDQNESEYVDDIKAGRIIYSRVKSKPADPNGNRGRYCITSRFVATYMSMKDRGLAYINACNGASDNASLMKLAFLNKGAGAYIGYDGQTTPYGYEPAAYLFDRMLGANLAEPPTPAGRPFKLDEVWEKMSLKKHATSPGHNYLTDPYHGSQLLKFEAGTTMLTPNIKSLRFFYNDYMGILTDVPAGATDVKVTIDGQPFDYQWHNGLIMVKLEKDTTGYVQLTVEDRESNKRPIVSWKGLVTYEQPIVPGGIGGNAKLTVKYNVHLRADAYAIRKKVDGPLQGEGTPFYAAMDTAATYEFSGTIGPGTWSGSGSFPIGPHPGPGNLFATTGMVLATEQRMKILPNFYQPVATITGAGASWTQVYAPAIGGWEFHDPLPVPGREIVYRGWYMDLDQNLNIKPKTYSGYMEGLVIHTISWPQMQANPPFEDKVER